MTSESFVSKVNSLDGCRIVYEDGNGFILQGSEGSGSRLYLMRSKHVEESSWEDVRGMLRGERPPAVMKHFSRVVGYYSNIGNWNRSKLAELKDRHKGNYAVPSDIVRNEIEQSGCANCEAQQN